MTTLLYFAYGSNMSTPRLQARVPSAQPVCVARLHSHQLRFHKHGRDGSAKCDIAPGVHPDDIVYGVVFEILTADKPALDHAEGLGKGYEQKTVMVVNDETETLNAFAYYAAHIDATLKPYHWYKEHVLRGALEHQLPNEYLKTLESIGSQPDPDRARHDLELSIYL